MQIDHATLKIRWSRDIILAMETGNDNMRSDRQTGQLFHEYKIEDGNGVYVYNRV